MPAKEQAHSWRFAPPPHDRIRAIPAFDDNYLWLIVDAAQRTACVVDPGDAVPVAAALSDAGLRLDGILLTHHHGDHVGGVADLVARWQCPVYGPVDERVGATTRQLVDGDEVELAQIGARLRTITVPGHTRSHIAYFAPSIGTDPRPVLFCGDTLFAAGCGRLFEGTPGQMHASLSRLASLPPETLVYCAHEYTLSNLRFAIAAEPSSALVAERLREAKAMREQHLSTVPTSIAIERATNPFLRAAEASLDAALATRAQPVPDDPAARFALLRQWKDVFR